MDDDAIRPKLAEKFRAHKLPRTMPNAVQGSTLEGFEPMTINGGKGKPCCVCDGMIQRSDEGSMEFTYPDGRSYAFHQRCEQLWQEERHKPILRRQGSRESGQAAKKITQRRRRGRERQVVPWNVSGRDPTRPGRSRGRA